MLVTMPGMHKMPVRIGNRKDPDQTKQSDLFAKPYWQATSVRNFRTFTIGQIYCHLMGPVHLNLF